MKMKLATYGWLLMLFALALSGCAGAKKTRCSCPNFRGSRAIFGCADEASDGRPQALDAAAKI